MIGSRKNLEYAGEDIEGKHTVMRLMRKYAASDREWIKLKDAMTEVRENGYGLIDDEK